MEKRVKILIAVKQVSVLEEDFELDADGRDIDKDFRSFDLNEWDDYSLEQALLAKEAGPGVEVVVVTVGADEADAGLRKCLAKGADRAIRVWDDSLADCDPVAIGRLLARVAAREAPDFFFAGVQSSDFAFGSTGLAAAGFLGWPHVAVVSKFELDGNKATILRELEGGLEEAMEVDLPAVLTIQLGINKPRYASLRGIKQAAALPIEALSAADLGLAASDTGATGSASRVRRMYLPKKSGGAELIEGTPAEQAAKLAHIIKTFQGA
jgi:electron transfer flavoprotein beta subunit